MDRGLIILLVVLLLVAFALVAICIFILMRSRNAADKTPAPVGPPGALPAPLSNLRGKVPSNRYQYRVPWVLAVGEPSAGKSTLISQLAGGDDTSVADEPGIQWKFLSRGALIDVPGSFLVSREGRAVPDAPWTKFLRLLLRHRAERPVDGIVLFIPAPDLLSDRTAEIGQVMRQTRAAAVRAKLDQIQQIIGVAAPAYIVVTKCDHIRGFRAFSETTGRNFDDDMFGWSNPNTLDTAFRPEWIDSAFDSMEEDLLHHQLRIFAREVVPAADDLFVFPLEFERLRAPLQTYLSECFHETSYLDPHFLRGIYFVGDASASQPRIAPVSEPLPPSNGTPPTSVQTAAPRQLIPAGVIPASASRLPNRFVPEIAFARHLFDLKVFLETGIARPLSRIWFPRNRALIATQIALAIFVLVFGVGTALGYGRLVRLRESKFNNVLDILVARIAQPQKNQAYPLSTAYDFVDALGVLDAQGFQSFFLPASWRDPINSAISEAISDSFSDTVLPSIQTALQARAQSFVGACGAVPPIETTVKEQVDPLALPSPKQDLEYIALEKSLTDYDRLRDAIRSYDSLRSPRGAFADLNKIFVYLMNKPLDDENRFRHNPYYQRAIQQATYAPVLIAVNGKLDDCVRTAMASRVHNFFESWFETNNPLIGLTDGIAQEIDDLQGSRAASRDKIETLVNDVRGLDALLSGGAYGWLREADYNRAHYAVLSKTLLAEPIADKAFLDSVDEDGSAHFSKAKSELLSTEAATTGFVLIATESGVRVSAPVIALQNGLSALLGQDFMAGQNSLSPVDPSTQPLIWNKAALTRASQMEDSYDKYVKEWLPLMPSGLRDAVRSVAESNLQTSVLDAVAKAQEPVDTGVAVDSSTLMLEIQSFQGAATSIWQLQNALPPAARGSRGDLQLLLTRQCVYLAGKLAGIFQANSLYQPAQASLRKWDGTKPLTEVGYSVANDDELETYFSKQRDEVKKIALDYAQPLAQYMSNHHVAAPQSFSVWPAIVSDVQDYEAKKPGNSISALEGFIKTGLDKIDPKTGCSAPGVARTGNDYFLSLRVDLQSLVTERCGELVQNIYANQIAAYFNQHLAGSFPFGPLPTGPEAPEASPRDTVEFFARLDTYGPGVLVWARSRNGYSDVANFLKQADAARQMLAGGLKDGALFSDVQVLFRANRAAEVLGDRIIDWELRAGDQTLRHGTVDGLRWSYGDPVRLTMRFAKDSPEIPIAGADTADARIDGRSVTYSYANPWALFEILRRHYGGDADYGAASGRALGLMRFVLPVAPDNTRLKPSPPAVPNAAARIYVRIALKAAGTKEPVEVPVAAFPETAPAIPVTSATTASE